MKARQVTRRVITAAVAALLFAMPPGQAAVPAPRQPSAEASAAFERYLQLTSTRMAAELRKEGPYLWVDLQPSAAREKYMGQLRRGEVLIEKLETRDNGKEIECPDCLIHHWIGSVFVPGVTLDQYLTFVQDYNRHQEYFAPDVARSSLLSRTGDDFKVFFRFRKKKVITAVHDTWHDVHYYRLGPTRGGSQTRTTQILDVENPGEPDERPRTAEEDRGFLWRLDTWWRFEQRDGGVYIQCESVSLTRGIPFGTGWLVGPFVRSIPREQLTFTLGTTRRVLMEQQAARGKP